MQIRDIEQLRDAPAFGQTAIEGFLAVESMLSDVLHFVPYCHEHQSVWSYHLARIILDACSQLDSLWKATASLQAPGTAGDRLTITDHHKRFGASVARQRVVFYSGGSPCVISPFQSWQDANFVAPSWWTAYNDLKHDRLSNQTRATLENAVNAAAALGLGILYSGVCDVAIISAGVVGGSGYNVWSFTPSGLLRDVTWQARTVIESKLFIHPLGVFDAPDCNLSPYWEGESTRFKFWWALNSHLYTKPRK